MLKQCVTMEMAYTSAKKRVDILEEINVKNKTKYLTKFIDTYNEVLLEEVKGNYMQGYTREYVRVYVKAVDNIEMGRYYRVKLICIKME